MTEDDWDVLLRWNSDPEVLWYSEGDDVTAYSLDDVQSIYRGVSESAFVFIAELAGLPIGEGWLQEMNMARILTRRPPEADLRRIDLSIGEKDLWGGGIGTRMIRLLTRFGFEACRADAIYGLPNDSNPRSVRAFEKNGYLVEQTIPTKGAKGETDLDLVLTREAFGGAVAPVKKPDDTTWAVLLDAGGVLLDETESGRSQAERISAALAKVVPGYSIADYRRDLEEAVATFCPRACRYVIWKHMDGDRELFDRFCVRHLERWKGQRAPLALMPGIAGEVRAMSGEFALAIAGQYGGGILDLLREHGLLDHFACRLHQGHFDVTKPDPRFFEQIARVVGVEPARCIVVGDRIDKDVVPAHTLGMKAIRIRLGLHRRQAPRIPEEIPDAELDSVTGLADAVRRLAGR